MNPINGYALKVGESICPATEQDLKDYLRIEDESCGSLEFYLDAANKAVIAFIGQALIENEYTLVFDGYPFNGTATFGLSRDTTTFQEWIELPYANLLEIESIDILDNEDGTATEVEPEDYLIDTFSSPARIRFIRLPVMGLKDRLKIVYKAGYGTDTEDVPKGIRLGIVQVAGYLYDHRGECSPEEAITKSGAGMALNPYRVYTKL
jgi:uncharacterized phiE125 gp8 family phage protein